jgi:ankyrin repeat protein
MEEMYAATRANNYPELRRLLSLGPDLKGLMQKLYATHRPLPLRKLVEDLTWIGDPYSSDAPPLRAALDQDALDTDDVVEIIEYLVEQNPEWLCARDQDGSLPLHVACRRGVSFAIIESMVNHAPQSLLVPRTTDGALALHVALDRGASSDSEVIKVLLDHHDPVTLTLRNSAGETPLHVACRRGASFEIVQSLVHYL